MKKLKAALFILALAVALYLVYYIVLNSASLIYRGQVVEVQPKPAPGQAQVAALPFAVGAAALVILILTMGIGFLGVVLAVALVIAVFQQLGIAGGEYVGAAFALGTALASYRHVKPLFGAPRSVSMLLASLAALAAAFSDLGPIVDGVVLVSQAIAQAFVQIVAPAVGGAQNLFIAAVVLLLVVRYVVLAVGSARDPLTVTIITLAAALLTIQVSTAVIQMTIAVFTQTYGTLGYAVLMLAAIVALADLFTAVEKASVDTLVWVAPLGVLAQAVFGIQVAPLIAALAGVAAVGAAFTTSPRLLSTALILALAASVLV